MKKVYEYTFPCGETIKLKANTGFAYGLRVSQKAYKADENTRQYYGFKSCKDCVLDCKKKGIVDYYNKDTNNIDKYEDTICMAYSKEYLNNKDKPTVTYLDIDDVGEYLIEIVIQDETYRAIRYVKGKSNNCGLMDLVDRDSCEDIFRKDYCKDIDMYSIWMTDILTGSTDTIEFESIDDIVSKIVSVRFVNTK